MLKTTISIRGLHCRSCELLVEKNLKKIDRVKSARVNYKTGKAEINYQGETALTNSDLDRAITEAGYEIGEPDKLPWLSRNPRDYQHLIIAGLILIILYFIGRWSGLFNLSVDTSSSSLGVPLLIGLVAGFSTCLALVGGLVLGFSARHAELHPEASRTEKFRPHLYFNLGRIAGYAILGGVIGLIGSALKLSPLSLGLMTIIVGLVMIFLGLKLVEIFPALKNKSLTLPSSLGRWFSMDKDNREYNHKAAILAGGLTFFLPCGFTQTMQLYAVSTGSFWLGALVMGLFALGTAPGLLSVGGLSSTLNGRKAKIFFAGAGLAVLLLGWYNIANGCSLLAGGKGIAQLGGQAGNSEKQIITMTQDRSGYHPKVLTVKKGAPVKWVINSTNPYSCASSLVVPSLGINKTLQKGENIIQFVPSNIGEIPFSCSMGMYRGKIVVTTDGDTNVQNTKY